MQDSWWDTSITFMQLSFAISSTVVSTATPSFCQLEQSSGYDIPWRNQAKNYSQVRLERYTSATPICRGVFYLLLLVVVCGTLFAYYVISSPSVVLSSGTVSRSAIPYPGREWGQMEVVMVMAPSPLSGVKFTDYRVNFPNWATECITSH